MEIFYRRRTAMDQDGPIEVIHIVGTKHQMGDEWFTQIIFVYEEDFSIVFGDIMTEKPEAVLDRTFKWRHPVKFVDADEIIIS